MDWQGHQLLPFGSAGVQAVPPATDGSACNRGRAGTNCSPPVLVLECGNVELQPKCARERCLVQRGGCSVSVRWQQRDGGR